MTKETEDALRLQAEDLYYQNTEALKNTAIEETDFRKLNEELHIHQIELEQQNEQLRFTQVELETLRDKYINLYEFAPVGYLTLDENLIVVEVNFIFSTLLGFEKYRLLKQTFTHFIAPDDQDIFYHHLVLPKII